MRIKLLLLSLLFTCLNITGPVIARAAVTDEVNKTVDEVVRIVADKELKKSQNEAKRRQLLKAAIGVIFDYEEMARRSLAKHWKERTPAERKEFVQLFTTLLENSYAGKIESYNQEKIVYLKESVEGDHELGNCTTAQVAALIRERLDEIVAFDQNEEAAFLVL